MKKFYTHKTATYKDFADISLGQRIYCGPRGLCTKVAKNRVQQEGTRQFGIVKGLVIVAVINGNLNELMPPEQRNLLL